MLVVCLLGLLASIGLAFAPMPFVWIPLLWSGLFIHRAVLAERRVVKLALTNAAGILLVFSLAEGSLQLRPALELSGSMTDGYFRGHESLGYAPVAQNRATATRSFAGFVLLMTLMVTVLYNDLTRVAWIEQFMPWRN